MTRRVRPFLVTCVRAIVNVYAGGKTTNVRVRRLIYVLITLSFFLPPITNVPFSQTETPEITVEVLKTVSGTFSLLSPFFHVTTALLVVLIYRYGNRFGRVFDVHFAALFVFLAFANNIAFTESYGPVVLTGNMVPMIAVALFWIWEAYRPQNDFTPRRLPTWRYWVVPLAILAFWFPVADDLSPDFSPLLLLTSDYGIFFCPTTPVVLAILTLIYPNHNPSLLTVTSLVGLILGFFNAMTLFIVPEYTLWMLVLHLPLILISIYGLTMGRLVPSKPGVETVPSIS